MTFHWYGRTWCVPRIPSRAVLTVSAVGTDFEILWWSRRPPAWTTSWARAASTCSSAQCQLLLTIPDGNMRVLNKFIRYKSVSPVFLFSPTPESRVFAPGTISWSEAYMFDLLWPYDMSELKKNDHWGRYHHYDMNFDVIRSPSHVVIADGQGCKGNEWLKWHDKDTSPCPLSSICHAKAHLGMEQPPPSPKLHLSCNDPPGYCISQPFDA